MYAGELVEEGEVRDVFQRALHPYTLGLLACLPRVEADKREVLLASIPGLFPRPGRLPAGCIFAPRCPGAQDACRAARPPLVAAEAGHRTACRRWPDLRRAPREFVAAPARPAGAEAVEAPGTAEAPEPPIVLEAVGLRKYFPAGPRGPLGLLRGARPVVRAVDDISVRVRQGLTMGIVGESGCGKTTLARCIAALEEASAGKMELEGEELPRRLARRSPAQLKRLQMVFQNPDASLNPQLPVEASLARPLALRARLPRAAVRERVRELLRAVQLPEDYARRLPHELSGGEKQRVAIARSLATEPALMICDEPLSSLDVSVQASLMNLLADLQDSRGTSYLFISHDLSAVRYLSDWIAVIYLGRLWEIGSAAEVFSPPHHPYTEALLSAMPVPDPDARRRDIRLGGGASSAVQLPTGCRFHPRCPRKLGKICETLEPPWQVHGQWHRIRCHIPPGELLRLQKKEGS
jgi:peptide/nickel transport system ATP-binding protein